MPSYAYQCLKPECKHLFGVVKPCSECKTRELCPECGSDTVRDYVAEHGQTFHKAGNWPMKSDACGVHPDQRSDAYKDSVNIGCPTEFDKEGRAVFTSASHRKKYCEAKGYFDRNGGYSDPKRR